MCISLPGGLPHHTFPTLSKGGGAPTPGDQNRMGRTRSAARAAEAVALGAGCGGNSAALPHRAAPTWARRGAFFPAGCTPAAAGASLTAVTAAAPSGAPAAAAGRVPTLAPIVRPAHVVRNGGSTWRRPRGAARKNCFWDSVRGAWVPSLPH